MTAGRCLGNITNGHSHNLLFAACKAHNSLSGGRGGGGGVRGANDSR